MHLQNGLRVPGARARAVAILISERSRRKYRQKRQSRHWLQKFLLPGRDKLKMAQNSPPTRQRINPRSGLPQSARKLTLFFRCWCWFVEKFIKQRPSEVQMRLPKADVLLERIEFDELMTQLKPKLPRGLRSYQDKARFERFRETTWLFYNICLHPNLSFEIFDTGSDERGFGVRFKTYPNRNELLGLLVPLRNSIILWRGSPCLSINAITVPPRGTKTFQ